MLKEEESWPRVAYRKNIPEVKGFAQSYQGFEEA